MTRLPILNHRPNVHRDLDAIFRNYDEAALSGVPRYGFGELYPEDVPGLVASGELAADGSDAYGRRHVKASQHWHLIEWLQSRFGVSIAYRNWGIGATHSGPGLGRDGLLHMAHPDRLAAILGDRLDAVNIATGMNELGAASTYDNLMHIGSAFRQRGTLVILCAPLRPYPTSRMRLDHWRRSCEDIERAARDLDCACVQSRHAFDDDGLLGWLAPDELCAANANNHPGIRELAKAGDLAIDLFR